MRSFAWLVLPFTLAACAVDKNEDKGVVDDSRAARDPVRGRQGRRGVAHRRRRRPVGAPVHQQPRAPVPRRPRRAAVLRDRGAPPLQGAAHRGELRLRHRRAGRRAPVQTLRRQPRQHVDRVVPAQRELRRRAADDATRASRATASRSISSSGTASPAGCAARPAVLRRRHRRRPRPPAACACAPAAGVRAAREHPGPPLRSRTASTAPRRKSTAPPRRRCTPARPTARCTTDVGTVDPAALSALVRRAAETGLLHGAGYERAIDPGGFHDELTITAGPYQVTFVATRGRRTTPPSQSLIAEFERCSRAARGGGLTCGSGFACGDDGACIEEQSCVCPALYDPQCGIDGQTYSNGCAAGCADMPIAHDGECGIAGDMCGSLAGLGCLDDYRCRYDVVDVRGAVPRRGGHAASPQLLRRAGRLRPPPAPGGAGHVGVRDQRVRLAGRPRRGSRSRAAGSRPRTRTRASASAWKQLYLPADGAGDAARRRRPFNLETELRLPRGVDVAERRVAPRRSATPARRARPRTEEFPGRYHYLRFVSDSSVQRHGFTVDPAWR